MFVVVGIWYLGWRPGTLNPDAMVFSAVVYGAEVFGFACAMLYLTNAITHTPNRVDRASKPPQ